MFKTEKLLAWMTQPDGKYEGAYRIENGKTIWLCEEIMRLEGTPVPDGHKVVFKDGNPFNCTVKNLTIEKCYWWIAMNDDCCSRIN